jgi:RNA polymerase sigma factor (sigma-70 family)
MCVPQIECMELISACAQDTENSALWTEFLIRYSSFIKRFISKTWILWQVRSCRSAHEVFGGEEQSDLFQAVIVRLVENRCALMKRFVGTEDDWLAYVATITYSVVCDTVRRHRRSKRRRLVNVLQEPMDCWNPERKILAREIITLCDRMTRNLSPSRSARDRLIFLLYFIDDLSESQIARCQGLSKSGVQDVINRIVTRARRIVKDDASQLKIKPAAGI